MEITYTSTSRDWYNLIKLIFEKGDDTGSRGLKYREILDLNAIFKNPNEIYIDSVNRKTNLPFAITNLIDLVLNTNLSLSVNPKLQEFVNNQTSRQYGDYSERINLPKGSQIARVISQLKSDINTRQAVIIIHNPLIEDYSSNDIACTLSLQFLHRNGKLNLFVKMRSNDMYLGNVYDTFQFQMLQREIASILKADTGEYHHAAGSAHVYSTDFNKIKKLDDFTPYSEYRAGKITTKSYEQLVEEYQKIAFMLGSQNLGKKIKELESINDEYHKSMGEVLLAYYLLEKDQKVEAKQIANKITNEFRYYFARRGII